jgi:hypothetical protein
MSQAVQHNLPIFSKKEVIINNGRYFIDAFIGYESYLGIMNTSPRRDYFAFIRDFNGKNGQFKLGRLDISDINKKVKSDVDSILLEVVPNKYGSYNEMSEFIPKMKSGYLCFSTEKVTMSFFDWIKFLK